MSNQKTAPVSDGRVMDSYRGVGYALPRKLTFLYEAGRSEPRVAHLETLRSNINKTIDAALRTKDPLVIQETRSRIATFWSELAAESEARFPDDTECPAAACLDEYVAECDAGPAQMQVLRNPTPQNIERALPRVRHELRTLGRMVRVWERTLHVPQAAR